MKSSDSDKYRCPACQSQLELNADFSTETISVETGTLSCRECRSAYPIINAIPRFASDRNYADSFGLEWQKFPKVLLDENWQEITRQRFYQTADFARDLHGELVLEVGCGSGAFTRIILETGAHLFSSDLSKSVDVCKENLIDAPNLEMLSLCQADLHALPFASGVFDKVLCLGVIQHCPDPALAFHELCRHVKPGGEIVIDCYLKQPMRSVSLTHVIKHTLRKVTTRMPERLLLRAVIWIIHVLYNVKALISRIPVIGGRLHRIVAIGELRRRDWTPEQMKMIKSLNVFDMLSPKFDNPQSLDAVRAWVMDAGLELVKCDIGHNGINAKARKPRAAH